MAFLMIRRLEKHLLGHCYYTSEPVNPIYRECFSLNHSSTVIIKEHSIFRLGYFSVGENGVKEHGIEPEVPIMK